MKRLRIIEFLVILTALAGCAPLPGIVIVTPEAAFVEVTQPVPATATSLPATPAPTEPPLPLPATNTIIVATTAVATPIPTLPGTPVSEALQTIVQSARDDLVKRLSIPAADITLIQASEVSWADLSLGCPQPGMMYGQMVTSGYLVILQAGGAQYYYHAGPDRTPFYCGNPHPPIQVGPGE